jgi:dual specificity tyrosine-phosphorylation-regulated kinase 2/3/4
MWSFACILPELRTAVPSFPGESELDQLACIVEVIGHPPRSMFDQMNSGRREALFSYDDHDFNDSDDNKSEKSNDSESLKKIKAKIKQDESCKVILEPSPNSKVDRIANSRSIGSLINARVQDSSFISFLTSCFIWEPQKRMTPQNALKHAWLETPPDKFLDNNIVIPQIKSDHSIPSAR